MAKTDRCADCRCYHSDLDGRTIRVCKYPGMRALFDDVTQAEDRFLRWMAGWDEDSVESFKSLLRRFRYLEPRPGTTAR